MLWSCGLLGGPIETPLSWSAGQLSRPGPRGFLNRTQTLLVNMSCPASTTRDWRLEAGEVQTETLKST